MPHPGHGMRNLVGNARALPQATVDQILAVDPLAVHLSPWSASHSHYFES